MTARTSIYGSLSHGGQPIPAAARVGDWVATGGVSGASPKGEMPKDIERQCANMFANLRTIIEAAGSSPDLILKLTIYVLDRSSRNVLNRFWVEMFPDPNSRPARHVLVYPELPNGMLLQCEALALAAPSR